MKGEKAPRCYLKKNRRLCAQLFEISRLLFSNCLLSSAKIAIRLRLARARSAKYVYILGIK